MAVSELVDNDNCNILPLAVPLVKYTSVSSCYNDGCKVPLSWVINATKITKKLKKKDNDDDEKVLVSWQMMMTMTTKC